MIEGVDGKAFRPKSLCSSGKEISLILSKTQNVD